jgi:hypothetical protein
VVPWGPCCLTTSGPQGWGGLASRAPVVIGLPRHQFLTLSSRGSGHDHGKSPHTAKAEEQRLLPPQMQGQLSAVTSTTWCSVRHPSSLVSH